MKHFVILAKAGIQSVFKKLHRLDSDQAVRRCGRDDISAYDLSN